MRNKTSNGKHLPDLFTIDPRLLFCPLSFQHSWSKVNPTYLQGPHCDLSIQEMLVESEVLYEGQSGTPAMEAIKVELRVFLGTYK